MGQRQTGHERMERGRGTTSRDSSISECASALSTKEYRFKVRAENVNGWGLWSWPLATTAIPGKVATSAITTVLSGTQMSVSWTAPYDGGLEITDYDVRYRACTQNGDLTCAGKSNDNTAWGSWTTLAGNADPGSTRTATITGLTVGTVYQVQVQSLNARGRSDWSGSVEWPQPPTAPAAPTVTLYHRMLGVAWTAPAANGAAVTDYDVRYRACTATPKSCAGKDNDDTAWESTWTDRTGETTSDTATSADISGLTDGTAYQFQVRASNIIGDSAWSVSARGVPAPQVPDAPGAPTLTVHQTSLGVAWTAPTANGSSITDYDVQYRACTATPKSCTGKDADDTAWGAWTDRSGETTSDTATSATVTGLTKATAYQVQVRASNGIGDGGWSPHTTGIPADKPVAPAAPTLTAYHAELGVSWTAPSDDGGSAVGDYDVQYRACTHTADLTCAGKDNDDTAWGTWTTLSGAADPGTSTAATITGLTDGTSYQVQVRASNPAGAGAWSASATRAPAPEVPDTPTAPTLTEKHLALGVAWTAPAANGETITDYDVQHRVCRSVPTTCAGKDNDGTAWDAWIDRTGETASDTAIKVTITGLTNGTGYQARVRAANSVGEGGWSAASAGAVPATQKPDAPTEPTVAYNHESLDVSWTAPASNGLTITGYNVQYRACTKNTGLDLRRPRHRDMGQLEQR